MRILCKQWISVTSFIVLHADYFYLTAHNSYMSVGGVNNTALPDSATPVQTRVCYLARFSCQMFLCSCGVCVCVTDFTQPHLLRG